jgi:hypothetical protein
MGAPRLAKALPAPGARAATHWIVSLILDTAASVGLEGYTPDEPLARLADALNEMDPVEWPLLLLCIEIELRVDLPDELADATHLSALELTARVLALPRVSAAYWTRGRLRLLASAMRNPQVRQSSGATTRH